MLKSSPYFSDSGSIGWVGLHGDMLPEGSEEEFHPAYPVDGKNAPVKCCHV